MDERIIFLNVLEEEDTDRRRAYLDFACAGKPALRQRIEALLRSHQDLDSFLEVPVIEQLAHNDQALSFLTPSTEPGSLGKLDLYEVLEVIGRGSTAVVLKGRDTRSDRIVAIKVLNPLLAAIRTARRLFIRQAQAAAAVRDDHVIAIHAVSDHGLLPYVVMEYIAGITLADRIAPDRPLELKEILRIGMQIAKGLAAAHAQGLVHRDIKPGNILLENGVQRVKITDFGLAYAEKGVIIGTPMFMSPEQASGRPFDHRTDLFSLGSVLYSLCAGQPPFSADNTVVTLRRVCEDTPRPIREMNADVPIWLSNIIEKLLAKEMDKRFASAREVADLLTHHLESLQRPFPVPPAAAVSNLALLPEVESRLRPGSPLRRRYWFILASLAGLLVVLGLLAFCLVRGQYRRPANETNLEKRSTSTDSRFVTGSREPKEVTGSVPAVANPAAIARASTATGSYRNRVRLNGRRQPSKLPFSRKERCHGYRCG